jgi:hypothetical protein
VQQPRFLVDPAGVRAENRHSRNSGTSRCSSNNTLLQHPLLQIAAPAASRPLVSPYFAMPWSPCLSDRQKRLLIRRSTSQVPVLVCPEVAWSSQPSFRSRCSPQLLQQSQRLRRSLPTAHRELEHRDLGHRDLGLPKHLSRPTGSTLRTGTCLRSAAQVLMARRQGCA